MPQTSVYSRYGQPAANPLTTKPARQRSDPCADPCLPACPACGGLKCLCRPRFFPGQLLTDEDLNRLENYVVEKNRLHNRYLVGWGVACGLEVSCDGCDSDSVVVSTGYALSPCGDDIVVCRDASVNICSLINQCQPQGDPNCDPAVMPAPRDCRGGSDRWVLAICYDEAPSRGITALLGAGDNSCNTKCSCGGSSSCGCGGKASGSKSGGCGCGAPAGSGCSCNGTSTSTGTRKRTYTPQCEATQICESYRFIVYPAPKATTSAFAGMANAAGVAGVGINGVGEEQLFAWLYANRARFGPLLERLLCCVLRAFELRSTIREGRNIDGANGLAVYRDYASALKDFAADFALNNCRFVAEAHRQYDDAKAYAREAGRLAQLQPEMANDIANRLDVLDAMWLEIVTECFCSALLPACPSAEPKNCVPLAVITVGAEPCSVVSVCNWEERKLLITWRTITYWLSWLPWQDLRSWIAKLCCSGKPNPAFGYLLELLIAAMMSRLSGNAGAAKPNALKLFRAKAVGAAGDGEGDLAAAPRDPLAAAMQSPNLLMHLMAGLGSLSDGTDVNAPQWASIAARLFDGTALAPLAGAKVGAGQEGQGGSVGGKTLGKRAGDVASTDSAANSDRTLKDLQSRLAALSKKVATQDRKIAELKRG